MQVFFFIHITSQVVGPFYVSWVPKRLSGLQGVCSRTSSCGLPISLVL
uniref:Uncharacterized protein n=1 Tax=Arundo donax TaxID=35708 RepID=A0A0A9DVS8_ARUDO